jgi:Na+/H+-dicarboxylate symporter
VSPDKNKSPSPRAGRRRTPGPSARILIGLGAGVAAGLFVGERAAMLQPVADAYIRLMQMTVLPYLVLTLVGGIGRLDRATARRLGGRALVMITAVAGVGLVVTGLMPLAFPNLESASFYSDALIEPRQAFALGEIYVPANPFQALANAVVPGVVLFSLALGVALIGVADKDPLLASLRALENAVSPLPASCCASPPTVCSRSPRRWPARSTSTRWCALRSTSLPSRPRRCC